MPWSQVNSSIYPHNFLPVGQIQKVVRTWQPGPRPHHACWAWDIECSTWTHRLCPLHLELFSFTWLYDRAVSKNRDHGFWLKHRHIQWKDWELDSECCTVGNRWPAKSIWKCYIVTQVTANWHHWDSVMGLLQTGPMYSSLIIHAYAPSGLAMHPAKYLVCWSSHSDQDAPLDHCDCSKSLIYICQHIFIQFEPLIWLTSDSESVLVVTQFRY